MIQVFDMTSGATLTKPTETAPSAERHQAIDTDLRLELVEHSSETPRDEVEYAALMTTDLNVLMGE